METRLHPLFEPRASGQCGSLPESGAVARLIYMRPDGIGDAVLSNCLLSALPELYPGAEIIVVCDAASEAVFAASPLPDRVITLRKSALQDDAYLERVSEELRCLKADLLFNAVLSPSRAAAALMLGLDIPILSLSVNTANMAPADRERFLERVDFLVPVQAGVRLEIDRYTEMLRRLGLKHGCSAPRLWLAPENEEAAAETLRRHALPEGAFIALFAAGGMWEKGYTAYGEALAETCLREGLAVAALGAEADRELNEQNVRVLKERGVHAVNLCENGSLLRDAALLRFCRLAVGADTALAHMACALGVPLVVLVSGSLFGRFFPYQAGTTAVCLPLSCAGCEGRCRYERPFCMTRIHPATVREAVNYALASADGEREKTLYLQNPALWPAGPGLPVWQSPGDFIRVYKKAPDVPLRVVVAKA